MRGEEKRMKLVLSIVQNEDASKLLEALQKEGFMATKVATSGGFLRSGNTTLLIGVDEDSVDKVIEIIQAKCKTRKQVISSQVTNSPSTGVYIPYPVEVTIGGATIFVLNVERFEKV